MALTDKLTAIADAIRAKTGGTAAMTPAEMPGEIASITPAPERYIVFDYDDITVEYYSKIVSAHMFGYNGDVPSAAFANPTGAASGPFVNLNKLTADVPPVNIGDAAFYYTRGLTDIDLSCVETIGSQAFERNVALTGVELPVVKKIDRYAFRYCSGLQTVRIGAYVAELHALTFGNCTALKDIYIDQLQSESPVAASAPWGAPNNPTIHWRTA